MKSNHYISLLILLISASCSDTIQPPVAAPKSAKIMQTSGVTNDLNGVFFEDTQNGFVVGDSGTIITTTNGGESWSKVQTNFTKELFSCFAFGGKKYIGGRGIISFGENLASLDNTQDVGNTMVNSFASLNDGRVVAVGGFYAINFIYGNILTKSQNSNTWSSLADSLIPFGFITDVITTNSNTILYCISSCRFCYAGINRINFDTPTKDSLLKIAEYGMKSLSKSGSIIVSVGRNTEDIARSTNSGASWSMQAAPNNAVLNDVAMISPTTGYACGDGGVLLITEDGGQTWSALQSGTTKNLNSIFFPTSTVGYAVGENGTIVKIDLGGN